MRKAFGLTILAALLVVGTAAGIFTARGGASPSVTKPPTVKITVNATDYRFALSKQYVPVVGTTVIFTVVNKGKISHDFFIAGKITKTLNPGQSQKITVKFKKKGKYAYLCTILGHAAARHEGQVRRRREGREAAGADDHDHDDHDDDPDDDHVDADGRYGQHDGSGRHVRVPLRRSRRRPSRRARSRS